MVYRGALNLRAVHYDMRREGADACVCARQRFGDVILRLCVSWGGGDAMGEALALGVMQEGDVGCRTADMLRKPTRVHECGQAQTAREGACVCG